MKGIPCPSISVSTLSISSGFDFQDVSVDILRFCGFDLNLWDNFLIYLSSLVFFGS